MLQQREIPVPKCKGLRECLAVNSKNNMWADRRYGTRQINFKLGCKGKSPSNNDATTEAKEGGFVKAKAGGITLQATLLVNNTDKILYLRDKVGAAYGNTRYKIPGMSQIEVSPLQHTFFKMLAYAVEEDSHGKDKEELGNPQTSDLQTSKPSNEKKMSTDTRLTIDSDQLSDNKRITITREGSNYKLEFLPR